MPSAKAALKRSRRPHRTAAALSRIRANHVFARKGCHRQKQHSNEADGHTGPRLPSAASAQNHVFARTRTPSAKAAIKRNADGRTGPRLPSAASARTTYSPEKDAIGKSSTDTTADGHTGPRLPSAASAQTRIRQERTPSAKQTSRTPTATPDRGCPQPHPRKPRIHQERMPSAEQTQ